MQQSEHIKQSIMPAAIALPNGWAHFDGPCYDPQKRYGDCPASLQELVNDTRIPAIDRIWAFAHCDVVSSKDKRVFAVQCARSTPLSDGRTTADLLTDPRSIAALEVAERYAHGTATVEELADMRRQAKSAAYAAAWSAASSSLWAAWAAAWAAWAARDAARSAASSAAWAARDAARSASRFALRSAASAAASAAQLHFIKQALSC